MKKKLAGLLWLSLTAVSPLALALGLGPATVNSPLDAPLDATVPLQESERFALSDLRVEVANESAFRALGLEWTPLTASISVQIQAQPDGHRLLLRSSQAVHEPWLDLLLSISSPEGRQTRALTLLFDPPEYAMGSQEGAVSTPEVPSRTSVVTSPAARDIAYVASGDTFWGVAARVKPSDVTIQQMMMALLEANPGAFPTGNVDELRAGQTLNIPSRQRITSRTPSDAAQAIQAMRQPASRPVAEPQETFEGREPSIEQASEPAMVSDDQGANQSQEMSEAVAFDEEQVLAEQLLESQARLQAAQDERDQIRGDLATLREEVVSLTQALNASQRELREVTDLTDALAGSATLSGSNTENSATSEMASFNRPQSTSETIIQRITAYQWPLASVILALLLGALIWSRKRREREWEDVPAAASLSTSTDKSPESPRPVVAAEKTVEPSGPHESSVFNVAEHEASEQSVSEPVEPVEPVESAEPVEPVSFAPDDVGPKPFAPVLSASEPALSGSDVSTPDIAAQSSAPFEEEKDDREHVGEEVLALDNAFLAAPEPVEEPVSYGEGQQDSTIDYEPPAIEPHEPAVEAPRQPAVDFTWDYVSAEQESGMAKAATVQQQKAAEDEWEIEEVAFEPRRRDNGAP
ncbi:LysM peptidoglycan-binding domain-containing protein [Halomonas qinghailakensis]|uniref:LysM peptidoglycan-binding domain-containing protein n=1 Tax=Halomonas qinghailakensis TaxID=2937790 RepID=A0AA46TQG7_9GAMM|nr:FimV/HubP family polar landmark protein [Halomonas sp. ZZQ-149]UYO74629.1 LysM peptidoglycan-binding domain-containing protein [Halomonas sp. ZZQ-149]